MCVQSTALKFENVLCGAIRTYVHTQGFNKHTYTRTQHTVLSSPFHIFSLLSQTSSDGRDHFLNPSQLWQPPLTDSLMPAPSPPVVMGYTSENTSVRFTHFSKVGVGIRSIMIHKAYQFHLIHY